MSADLMQIGIVKESTYGVTPTNPVFQILPYDTEGLEAEPNNKSSSRMNPQAQRSDTHLLNVSPGGPITSEFSDSPAMRILLESAMRAEFAAVAPGSEPSGAPLNPNLYAVDMNKDIVSFSIEKKYPDPDNPVNFLYQRITGVVATSLSIGGSAEDVLMVSFNLIGKTMSTGASAISGATYVEPSETRVWRGSDVAKVTVGSIVDAPVSDCAEEFSVDIALNFRARKCLGVFGNQSVVVGQATVDVTLSRFYHDNDVLDALLAQTEIDFLLQVSVPNIGATGVNWFSVEGYRGKLTRSPAVAGGSNQDVIDDMSFSVLYDSTEGTTLEMLIGEGATS